MRIYLTGRLAVETGGALLDERQLPARQGRVAFTYLVLHRRRAIPRPELAQAVWGSEPPEGWDASLSALLSRLRRLLRDRSIAADIETLSGGARLQLPPETWVDLEAARNAIDDAAGALRAGHAAQAWANAAVACSVFERGFLDGEELPWVVRMRDAVLADHLRALECLADASLLQGDPEAALRYARLCSDLHPYRESAYERQMRAHISMGNRAEALRVYERLRVMLAEELGTNPSPTVQAVHLQALGD